MSTCRAVEHGRAVESTVELHTVYRALELCRAVPDCSEPRPDIAVTVAAPVRFEELSDVCNWVDVTVWTLYL